MNNPIEIGAFKHFLRFVSLDMPDLYQISEPIGFDSAEFVVKQNDNRFSRDITYMADDKKTFTFYKQSFEKGNVEQVQNIEGYTSYYLDQGVDWIFETNRRFGFEGKIEYILQKEGVDFVVGILSMALPDTDNATYYSCNIIQDDIIAAYAKHEDTTINVFSDKNVLNETITPVETFNFLRKSVPIFQTSKWIMQEPLTHDALLVYSNFSQSIEKSEIKDTLTFFENYPDVNAFELARNNFIIIRAKNTINNIKIKIDLDATYVYKALGGGDNCWLRFWIVGFVEPYTIGDPTIVNDLLYSKYFSGNTDQSEILPSELTYEVANLPKDYSLALFVEMDFNRAVTGDSDHRPYAEFRKFDTTVTGAYTSLNTVVKGVRYVDMMKQASKFIRNIPINAPKFDIGGQFYDQVCYNRALVSQNTTIPFNTNFKEILGSVVEVCADYEVKADEIFVGQYDDYYTNEEIGVFNVIPSIDYKEPWNERFKLNIFKFGYKTFEQNRDSVNTIEDVHTDSEWIVPNELVQNKKEISLDLVRSGFSQQAAVDLEIQKPTTSDTNDNKVYIQDIIPLPEDSFNEFGAKLLIRIVSGNVQILNRDSEQDSNDVVINWTVLGFNIGDPFYITSGVNIGSYEVVDITPTTLTLEPLLFTPTTTGDHYISMKWYYIDILWQTRTNEGFDIVNGVTSPQYFPNLLYTIRRNMVNWESYLNTACSFARGKQIRNSYFKNDVPLETQFDGGIVYLENAPIDVDSLQPRILSPKIIELEVVSDFEDILNLLNTYKTERGFVRCYDLNGKVVKGYFKELSQSWKTNSLKLKLEEKYEEENLKIDFVDGVLLVNDVYYELSGINNWYKIYGNFFVAFDKNSIAICNKYRYDNVVLNGVKYNSIDELLSVLLIL